MSRSILFLGCSSLLYLASGDAAWAEEVETTGKKVQRYALLIAADDYAPPLAKLQYCHNDMTELATRLESAGFAPDNITFMNDRAESSRLRPTRANIERELNLRLQLANPDDIVLVAFSGHGVHVNGTSYLCPTDANLDGPNSLVSINDIYGHLEKCVAGQKLLIIDACRDELIIRGFKSAQLPNDLAIQVQSPPRGLVVLSSCEPKQFSAEDPELKQGVFMHYIIEGLEGKADENKTIGGNANGRISLDELYYYAHEKTKLHVARSHGIVQRPVMKGEIIGRFEVANVPDQSTVRTIVRREKAPVVSKPVETTAEPAPPAENEESPLLRQADDYLREGQYDNAIQAYSAIIDDATAADAIRREARIGRGAAYIARAGKDDLDKALIDQLAAGHTGIQLTVRAPSANLQIQKAVTGKVKQNQSIIVTKINGDWLWVASVDGSDKVKGYIPKSAVLEQPEVAAIPESTAVRSPAPQQWQPKQYDENWESRPHTNKPRPSNPHESPVLKIGKEILQRKLQSQGGGGGGGSRFPRW